MNESVLKLISFVQMFGFAKNVTVNSAPVVIFALLILIFGVISMLCILNIIIYLLVLYYSDHDIVLQILNKYTF